MEISSPQCKLRQCFLCGCSTAYFCSTCKHDLCLSCKETHKQDPRTIDHKIIIYPFPKLEICARHPNSVYKKYCTYCELPICSKCTGHEKHTKVLVIDKVCQLIRDQHREKIDILSSETLLSRTILLKRAKADVEIALEKCLLLQNKMLTKAQTLKDLTDKAKKDFMNNVFCDFDFKHRCLKQQKELVKYIVNLQKYVYRYERSSSKPLQFISLRKTIRLTEVHLKLHTSQHSMTESVKKEDVMESLSETIIERGYRHVSPEFLLTCLPKVEFHHTFKVNDIFNCIHISCINMDRIWVSGMIGRLILSNRSGEILLNLNLKFMLFLSGNHTVNRDGDLIYIGNDFKLSKFTKENKTIPICRTNELSQEWVPECVYSSLDTEDILVGMSISTVFPQPKMTDLYRFEKRIGKIFRFNKNGLLTQQHTLMKKTCFPSTPQFITENNNGDVVISALNRSSHEDESGAVIVTDQSGKSRFIYRGNSRRSELQPRGICTDALLHILVCDLKTHSVQMLDKDGKFLSHLLIRPPGIFTPSSLFYDSKTHHIWVGSNTNNTVCVYRYLTRPDNLADKKPVTAEKLRVLNEINKSLDLNEFLQYLLSSPVVSKNPAENCFFFRKTLERHHGRNIDTASSLWSLRETENDETENSQEDYNQSVAKAMQPLSKTKISPEGVECPLQLMPSTKLIKFFTVTEVNQCRHICCMTPGVSWIDKVINDIILKNKQCNTLHKISDRPEKEESSGSFTLNNEHELIYISKDLSIKKLSSDLTTTTIIIPKWRSAWKPRCVYWSQSSKSLLVGMRMRHVYRGMITRYNPTGELKQVIRYDTSILELYRNPCFITENNNGDIVVSDSGSAVVVTDREGDVFDIRPDTARSKTDETENSQEYWNQSAAKTMRPLSKTKISPEGVECPLQLMLSTKLIKFFTVTEINQCRHICCMTPDLFWIDNDNNDIILKNIQCNTLHKISDRPEKEERSGSFTLNNEHELIYISKDLSIKKLSSDLTTTTMIIQKWRPGWKPRCVYWSQSFKSLLVGMCMKRLYRGMITRYNPTGELKQVIRYDNNRLELYRNPCFITENNNGDIVVSDSGSAVVVTDREGNHRFSYTGHPLRLGLEPRGICTDPLSNILVCDSASISLHVIDKDGQFLFYLQKPKKENWDICDLSYNVHSQQLWIASQDSKIWVLRYIKKTQ